MGGFVSQLEAINRLAELSPGFVWRLKAGPGTTDSYAHVYEDARIIVNMSVWESLEALRHFVYRTGHVKAFRDRRKWFEPMATPVVALWWTPAGSMPTVAEGRARLQVLERDGPTEYAFPFQHVFPSPEFGGDQTRSHEYAPGALMHEKR